MRCSWVRRFYVTRCAYTQDESWESGRRVGVRHRYTVIYIHTVYNIADCGWRFFTSTYNASKPGTRSQRGESPGPRRGFSPFAGFSFLYVTPHLSPLRSGFLCRTPGKYNRVQSSRRPTRNFSATILHKKRPMKVKRHGIRPHRRGGFRPWENKGKKRGEWRIRNGKTGPDLPAAGLMELMISAVAFRIHFARANRSEFSKTSASRIYVSWYSIALLLRAINVRAATGLPDHFKELARSKALQN